MNTEIRRSSPELMLLLRSAQGTMEARKKIDILISQGINWDLFLSLAMHHRIFPLVYKTLSGLNNPLIPRSVLDALHQEYRKNLLKTIVITGETVKLGKIFQEKEIKPIFLKGAPLAQKLYGDIALRMSKDIDIFVEPRDLEQAEKALLQGGYQKKEGDIPFTPRQRKEHLDKYHHYSYLHQDRGVNVELHWKMHQIDLKFSPLTKLTRNSVEIGSFLVPVLPNEEWLFFLMVHGSNHKWFRLRWLSDIERFFRVAEINWDKLVSLANCTGMRVIVHQTALLLEHFVDAPIPEHIMRSSYNDKKAQKLAKEVINHLFDQMENIHGPEPSYWQAFWSNSGYRLGLRSGWRNKFSFIISLLKPVGEDYKFVALPDSLYFLYYFIRPITWLKRRINSVWIGGQ